VVCKSQVGVYDFCVAKYLRLESGIASQADDSKNELPSLLLLLDRRKCNKLSHYTRL